MDIKEIRKLILLLTDRIISGLQVKNIKIVRPVSLIICKKLFTINSLGLTSSYSHLK